MIRFARVVLACAVVLGCQPCSAAGGVDRARGEFRAAWKAAQSGQVTQALASARRLKDYPLAAYLHYKYLSATLPKAGAENVRAFLAGNEGTLIGETLRAEWLKHLARNGLWTDFLQDYRPQGEMRLRCAYLLARIRTGAPEAAILDARPLWLGSEPVTDECKPAFALLEASPTTTEDLRWERVRAAIGAGNTARARETANRLGHARRAWVARWIAATSDPERALRGDALRAQATEAREIALDALARLARRDLRRALDAWGDRAAAPGWDARERGIAARTLALAAFSQDHADAMRLLDAVPEDAADAAVQDARLRIAIRRQDWEALARWTAEPPQAENEALRWHYWRARALEATGRGNEAHTIFESLARERDYYGFRAADRIGAGYRMNDRPIPGGDLAAIESRPGVARAREFFALKMRLEARREWYYEITHMPAGLLAQAAAYAYREGWYDRAVLTAARAGALDDLQVRFPTPFEALVHQSARQRKLPPAVLFSIIRAESAFMTDARSPVGAMGLMQLMPQTAEHTARTLGIKLNDPKLLYDARTNITLGSAYLKRMLDAHGGNLALAAAAYNAGPGRVRAWRANAGCMAAENWIELVPFTETRRYVRQALFNTVIYEWRLGHPIVPLADRVGPVPDKAGGTC
ncbi:MAG: transglycosylase SLT domain-containing protein [Gammaproteobacteria bacterium]